MVNYNNNKKGQAAIEFLMTYGWMLLVVLIVGALIFSFVDFGSLLPNKVELSNNFRADPTGSVAYAKDSTVNNNTVTITFRYNGVKRISVNGTQGMITKESPGGSCQLISIKNVDTTETATNNTIATFLNGHSGYAIFNCTGGGSNDLLAGDSLVGNMRINVVDTKTSLNIPTTGPIRLQIIKG